MRKREASQRMVYMAVQRVAVMMLKYKVHMPPFKLGRDGRDKCMDLEEAIEHLKEIIPTIDCEACQQDHIQLLEWLNELKERRNNETS